MREMQITGGLVILLIGLLLLAFTTGIVQMTLADVLGVILFLNGLFFIVPGFIFRKQIPALTFLFIPGLLAFAIGGILIYTAHIGYTAITWLWTLALVAIGVALLAIDWLGWRARWLKTIGWIITGVGILLFALFAAAWSTEPATRLIAPIVLVAFGLFFAFGALVPKRQM